MTKQGELLQESDLGLDKTNAPLFGALRTCSELPDDAWVDTMSLLAFLHSFGTAVDVSSRPTLRQIEVGRSYRGRPIVSR